MPAPLECAGGAGPASVTKTFGFALKEARASTIAKALADAFGLADALSDIIAQADADPQVSPDTQTCSIAQA